MGEKIGNPIPSQAMKKMSLEYMASIHKYIVNVRAFHPDLTLDELLSQIEKMLDEEGFNY